MKVFTELINFMRLLKEKDEVSGGTYDALDYEQLLWVHACLHLFTLFL